MSKARDSRNEKKNKKKKTTQAAHATKSSRQLLKAHAAAVSNADKTRASAVAKQIEEAKEKAKQ